MIPLLGFLPDADPAIPGVLTFVEHMIPTQRGMAGAPTAVEAVVGQPAIAAPCQGSRTLTNTLGVSRTFAGTQTKLYELSPPTWTDIGRAAAYTGTASARWMFAQFGNISLASNYLDVIQASSGGAFADVATAPKAKILITSKDFVLSFNTVDGTFGTQPDRWWCSAFQDYSSWTPSLTTQATTGRLVGVPGEITAAAMLGPYAVAYKKTGAYVGQFVGSPDVWRFDAVPAEFGCVGREAVADIGGAHFIVGPDNFWLFDGTRPTPIGQNEVREWFYRTASTADLYRTIVHYDQQNAQVWILFASPGATADAVDRGLVYDLRSKKWGVDGQQISAMLQFTAPGITYGTFASLGPTWADMEDIANDSPLLRPDGRVRAIFDPDGFLRSVSGEPLVGYITTGDLGVDGRSSYTDTLLAHFITEPDSSVANGFTKDTSGGTLGSTDFQSLADGKYDIRQAARWHRYAINFAGYVEIAGIEPGLRAEGAR